MNGTTELMRRQDLAFYYAIYTIGVQGVTVFLTTVHLRMDSNWEFAIVADQWIQRTDISIFNWFLRHRLVVFSVACATTIDGISRI